MPQRFRNLPGLGLFRNWRPALP